MCSKVDKEPKFWRDFTLPRERTVRPGSSGGLDFNNGLVGKSL